MPITISNIPSYISERFDFTSLPLNKIRSSKNKYIKFFAEKLLTKNAILVETLLAGSFLGYFGSLKFHNTLLDKHYIDRSSIPLDIQNEINAFISYENLSADTRKRIAKIIVCRRLIFSTIQLTAAVAIIFFVGRHSIKT